MNDPFVVIYTHEPNISYTIPYIPDPVFFENSNPVPKNVAGLRIRAHLCPLPSSEIDKWIDISK